MSCVERRVRIVADSHAEDPRQWSCISKMICWHRRYNLGDDHGYDCDEFYYELAYEADSSFEDWMHWIEHDVVGYVNDHMTHEGYDNPFGASINYISSIIDKEAERIVLDNYVVLPLYLYDHSGISMSVGGFSCPWDSGQVGYIFCDEETIDREFGGCKDKAIEALKAEVEVYDQFLRGDVYGFIVEEKDGDDWVETDSCWGFFGYDPKTNGMADHLGDAELIELASDAEIEYPSY